MAGVHMIFEPDPDFSYYFIVLLQNEQDRLGCHGVQVLEASSIDEATERAHAIGLRYSISKISRPDIYFNSVKPWNVNYTNGATVGATLHLDDGRVLYYGGQM